MNIDENLKKEYKILREKYISKATHQNSCPICNGDNLQKEFRNIVRLKNAEVYELSQDWYLSCTKCGLIMIDKIYPDAYYSEYINKFYTVDAVKVEEYSYTKTEVRLNLIKTLNKDFDNILEVSSFDGVTLSKFKEYFNSSVVGIEPTSSAVETSVREFPELEDKIVNDVFENFFNYKLSKSKFDLVMFSHCFRHFNDPLKSLKILNDLTKEGSIVLVDEGALIETILISATEAQIQRELFQQKSFYYSKHNIAYMFAKHGFKLVQTLYTDYNGLRFTGLVFEKVSEYVLEEEILEISRINSNSFLSLMKRYYYSTEDVIKTLKQYG